MVGGGAPLIIHDSSYIQKSSMEGKENLCVFINANKRRTL